MYSLPFQLTALFLVASRIDNMNKKNDYTSQRRTYNIQGILKKDVL
jgi:hypothetical protein